MGRPTPTLHGMNVSVLLRILPSSRTGGRLAGQAQVIETGETQVFADHDEMLAFLRHVALATSGRPATDDGPAMSGTPDHDQGATDQDPAARGGPAGPSSTAPRG